MLLMSCQAPLRLAMCLHRQVKAVRACMCACVRACALACLPQHLSTYRIGPPFRGSAQASSADTRAMGKHLHGKGYMCVTCQMFACVSHVKDLRVCHMSHAMGQTGGGRGEGGGGEKRHHSQGTTSKPMQA